MKHILSFFPIYNNASHVVIVKMFVLLSMCMLSSCIRDKQEFTVTFKDGQTISVKKGFRFSKCYTFAKKNNGDILLKGDYYIHDYYKKSNTITCRDVHNGHYALLNTQGYEVIPFSREYEIIIQIVNPTGEYYLFSKRAKIGICDSNGEELIPACYEWIGTCGNNVREPVSQNNTLVCRKNYETIDMYSLISKQVVGTYNKSSKITSLKPVENRYAEVTLDGKQGVFDLQSAREIIPTEYYKINVNCAGDNAYYFVVENFDDKVGAFDYRGTKIISVLYDLISNSDIDGYIEAEYVDRDYITTARVPSFSSENVGHKTVSNSFPESSSIHNGNINELSNSFEDNSSDNIKRLERMYKEQYQSWVRIVADNFNTLNLIKNSGSGYTEISQIQYNIRDGQNEMRKIRQEAANNGIIIEVSEYENKPL